MSAPSTAQLADGRDPAANPQKPTLRNRVVSIATGAAVVLLAVLFRLIDLAVLEQARMVAFDNQKTPKSATRRRRLRTLITYCQRHRRANKRA